MSDTSMGQGWWLASDGRWYPPQSAPGTPPPPPTAYPGGTVAAPGYAYTSTPARGMNGMAIASMVLGILWIYWIGSILALIFGYVARNRSESAMRMGEVSLSPVSYWDGSEQVRASLS